MDQSTPSSNVVPDYASLASATLRSAEAWLDAGDPESFEHDAHRATIYALLSIGQEISKLSYAIRG